MRRWAWGVCLVIVACAAGPGALVPAGADVTASGARQAEPGPSYTPTGPIVTDTGFRATKDGFGFPNYGLEVPYTNLTPKEMRKLFGDGVCATDPSDTCTMIPPAQQWQQQVNAGMQGHCFGFSVASLEMFTKALSPTDFGANSTPQIRIVGNDAIQRTLAYSYATQYLASVQNATITGTPNEMLAKLREVLVPGASDTYTIGIFSAHDGHAVTPYAIEDRGDGTYAVLIYDNNLPGTTRAVIFDTNADTWTYLLDPAGNPAALWTGNAATRSLVLLPTSAGIGQQPCPFCSNGGPNVPIAPPPEVPSPTGPFTDVFLQGDASDHGHLLLTDDQGRKFGYVGKDFVTEIPGVQVVTPMLGVAVWNAHTEPVYRIPSDLKVSLTLDGSTLERRDPTDVVAIGPGFDAAVRNIDLRPGQTDTLTLDPAGTGLSYTSTTTQRPTFQLGVVQPGESHAFTVSKNRVPADGTFTMGIDATAGQLNVQTTGARAGGTYDLAIKRLTTDGTQTFTHDNVATGKGASSSVDYGAWQSANQKIALKSVSPSGTEHTRQLANQTARKGG